MGLYSFLVKGFHGFGHYSAIPIFHDLKVNIIRRQRKKKKRCMPAIQEGRQFPYLVGGGIG
jgi:hypothetical protein